MTVEHGELSAASMPSSEPLVGDGFLSSHQQGLAINGSQRFDEELSDDEESAPLSLGEELAPGHLVAQHDTRVLALRIPAPPCSTPIAEDTAPSADGHWDFVRHPQSSAHPQMCARVELCKRPARKRKACQATWRNTQRLQTGGDVLQELGAWLNMCMYD